MCFMTKTKTLHDAISGLRFAMVTTTEPLSTRPLTLAEESEETLRFLVSSEADWVPALSAASTIASGSEAQVSLSDPKGNTYVALHGTAHVSSDRNTIQRLWSPGADVYFDGVDDPTIAVLEIEVESGEYWDGPSGVIGQSIALFRAALSDDPSKSGEHGKVKP